MENQKKARVSRQTVEFMTARVEELEAAKAKHYMRIQEIDKEISDLNVNINKKTLDELANDLPREDLLALLETVKRKKSEMSA